MKKIIKKVLTSLCALALCVFCLTGCSWLQIDKERYYKEVIVTIGNKESNIKEFTKKDLIDSFSNYGYQYYQSYGYSLEESINKTIESMIDRDLLMDVVKKEIDNDNDYKITDAEKKEIRKEVFDYMQDSINTYEEKVRKEWDMTIETEDEEETSSLRTAEEEYTPTTTYDYATHTVSRVEEEEENVYIPENLPEHFSKDYRIVLNEKVSNEAWTRYIKSLQDLAKSEGRSTKEADVLLAEEERLVELMTNNLYLEKYEKKFFDKTPVAVDTVLEYYREQYKAQYQKFSSSASLYQTAMESASSEYVYYHLDDKDSGSVDNKYINVKHILINFTEEQKAEISSLNTEYGISGDNSEEDETKKQNKTYQRRLNEIAQRATSTFEMSEEMYKQYGSSFNFKKVEGKKNTYTASAKDIYKFVKYYADGVNLKEKCQNFNELVYIFNDDSGLMNSEFDYVVNLDTNITDQMVKPFADGARGLDTYYGGEGEGSMTMIISEYGYHIIMHTGRAENIVEPSNIDNISDEKLLYILCNTMTTPESNKSIFNYIYDDLSLDDNLYNNMTSQVVANERTLLKAKDYVITYYESRYKDLWK